jgi:nicotinamidase-related amidase
MVAVAYRRRGAVTTPRRRPAPFDDETLLVVVDMQRLFETATSWQVPRLPGLVPLIARLIERRPARTILTRFMTPASADAAAGSWRRYYRRWSSVTLAKMDPALLELVPALAAFAPPGEICDKTTYSAFESASFLDQLQRRRAKTLIFCGIETDVCVLASVLGAIDHGYHVVLAKDAMASSSDAAHQAVLDLLVPRLDQQIQQLSVATILSRWTSSR